jgi:hypothetical protein
MRKYILFSDGEDVALRDVIFEPEVAIVEDA